MVMEDNAGGEGLFTGVDGLEQKDFAVFAAFGINDECVIRAFAGGADLLGLIVAGDHLGDVIGGLAPDLGRGEEDEPLIPSVIVLFVGLKGIGGTRNGDIVSKAFDFGDGDGISKRAVELVAVRVEFEYSDFVTRAVDDFTKGFNKTVDSTKPDGIAGVFGADVYVEPDFFIVRAGEFEDFLMRCEAGDSGSAGEVVGVDNGL